MRHKLVAVVVVLVSVLISSVPVEAYTGRCYGGVYGFRESRWRPVKLYPLNSRCDGRPVKLYPLNSGHYRQPVSSYHPHRHYGRPVKLYPHPRR